MGLIPGLGRSLEKETCVSILVWQIPWTEEPGMLHSLWGPKELGKMEHTHIHTQTLALFQAFDFINYI